MSESIITRTCVRKLRFNSNNQSRTRLTLQLTRMHHYLRFVFLSSYSPYAIFVRLSPAFTITKDVQSLQGCDSIHRTRLLHEDKPQENEKITDENEEVEKREKRMTTTNMLANIVDKR
jgi:hypothetical protein